VTDQLRVWRLRKEHAWLDARLCECADPECVEIQFFYDGTQLVARRWASREQALADAANQLRDLLRAGWTTHW